MFKLDCSKFYTYDEMEKLLFEIAEEYPDNIRLSVLAKTPENRNVYLATLADFSQGENAEKRPGYFVQAGLHSQEVSGPVAAMAVIERVLCDVPQVLNDTVFYVVPNINPDGMELALTTGLKAIRSRNRPLSGVRNGLVPCDLNGDGLILNMRRKNPLGKYKELEGFPGVMVPIKSGEQSCDLYDMWIEGRVENYDGGEIVLGVERLDFNRCYPAGWEPNLGKEMPLHAPEMRAVAEFEVAHPNIFAAVDFHNGATAILNSIGNPELSINDEDIITISDISRIAERITEIKPMNSLQYRNPKAVGANKSGTSFLWNYRGLGRSQYVIELGVGLNSIGMSSQDIFELLSEYPEDISLEAASVKSLCENEEFWNNYMKKIFVPWQPFNHPQLGEVEIGGFKGGNASYVDGSYMEKLFPKVCDFILCHAAMAPRLRVDNIVTTKVSENVYRIRADVMNTGKLSTRIMQGGGGVNANYKVRTFIDGANGVEILNRPAVVEVEQLKSMECINAEWFIRAKPGSEIVLASEHPRSATAIKKIVLDS